AASAALQGLFASMLTSLSADSSQSTAPSLAAASSSSYGSFQPSNVISANGANGVHLEGAGTTGNWIVSSLIGTDATGTYALGNAWDGVLVEAPNNVIGGTWTDAWGDSMSAGNLISGNGSTSSESNSLSSKVEAFWNFDETAANGPYQDAAG